MASTTKAKWSWRGLWRRLFPRPIPYWHTGMDRETPVEVDTAIDFGGHVSGVIMLGFFAAVCILTPMAYVCLIVFTYPKGFAGLIAHFLAEVCRATGNCDFGYLMAGFTFAVQILLIGFALIVIAMLPAKAEPVLVVDDDDISEHEQLDDRIVTLREELMAAGLLTKPPEEMPEEE
jgi:hypothetical protein